MMVQGKKKWTSVAAFSAACLATLGMAAATCGMAFLVTQAQKTVSQSAYSNSPAFSQDAATLRIRLEPGEQVTIQWSHSDGSSKQP